MSPPPLEKCSLNLKAKTGKGTIMTRDQQTFIKLL